MRTHPITLLSLVILLVAACNFQPGETVPKEDYDSIVQAYEELRVSAEATRDSYIEQASAVDNILQELSQVEPVMTCWLHARYYLVHSMLFLQLHDPGP